ncbi:MAG: hypothetical protein Q9227_000717 [Pyrenula ochraceoflavens]
MAKIENLPTELLQYIANLLVLPIENLENLTATCRSIYGALQGHREKHLLLKTEYSKLCFHDGHGDHENPKIRNPEIFLRALYCNPNLAQYPRFLELGGTSGDHSANIESWSQPQVFHPLLDRSVPWYEHLLPEEFHLWLRSAELPNTRFLSRLFSGYRRPTCILLLLLLPNITKLHISGHSNQLIRAADEIMRNLYHRSPTYEILQRLKVVKCSPCAAYHDPGFNALWRNFFGLPSMHTAEIDFMQLYPLAHLRDNVQSVRSNLRSLTIHKVLKEPNSSIRQLLSMSPHLESFIIKDPAHASPPQPPFRPSSSMSRPFSIRAAPPIWEDPHERFPNLRRLIGSFPPTMKYFHVQLGTWECQGYKKPSPSPLTSSSSSPSTAISPQSDDGVFECALHRPPISLLPLNPQIRKNLLSAPEQGVRMDVLPNRQILYDWCYKDVLSAYKEIYFEDIPCWLDVGTDRLVRPVSFDEDEDDNDDDDDDDDDEENWWSK